MLKIKNLSKVFKGSFGTVNALNEIDLSVNKGEILAVRGKSGCGKTTLLLTAGAMMAPTKGTVEVGGINPYKLSSDQRSKLRRDSIGYVFQQFNLIPYLSIFENIILPANPRFNKRHIQNRTEYLLDRFDLTDRAKHKPSQLSAGQQQRTALARALINEPELVLADEPTGNLDRENAKIVIDHLCKISQSGSAVVIVTHDPIIDIFNVDSIELDVGIIVRSKHAPSMT